MRKEDLEAQGFVVIPYNDHREVVLEQAKEFAKRYGKEGSSPLVAIPTGSPVKRRNHAHGSYGSKDKEK